MRILSVHEVRQLSGLQDILRADKHNPEVMTEKVVGDFCGNSFHPGLIDAALGTDQQFQAWAAGSNNAHSCNTVPPPIQEVYQGYQELLRLVLDQSSKKGKKLNASTVDYEAKWQHCADNVSDLPAKAPSIQQPTMQSYLRRAQERDVTVLLHFVMNYSAKLS